MGTTMPLMRCMQVPGEDAGHARIDFHGGASLTYMSQVEMNIAYVAHNSYDACLYNSDVAGRDMD